MKRIDLGNLPKRGKYIDWKSSIGCKCKFVYDDVKDEVEIIGYDKDTTTLNIKFYKKEYKLKTGSFTKCYFGRMLNKFTSNFKIEIGTILKDEKRDLVVTDREYKKHKNGWDVKYYKYTCNNCGWTEGCMNEYELLGGYGCSCCSSRVVVPGINDIPTTAPWMVKYFQGGIEEAKLYTHSSDKRIYPICPDCGRVKKKKTYISNIYRNHSIGCSCSDGKPYDEKLFYHIVNEQLGLNMLWGANKNDYPWMDKYIYDFVDEENKIIWELDGGLGHGNIIHSKCNKTLEETIKNDKYKDKLANKNGYEVVRIDTNYYGKNRFEYIKNSILNSKLLEKYNLSTIDWDKCHEFALSNLVKDVCEYYENNQELTRNEIADIFELSLSTIGKYLKQGEKLGWCSNVKETGKNNAIKCMIKSRCKKVKCIELNEEFESTMDCANQLTVNFNKKFDSRYIWAVCRGKQKTHQGFHFKYISHDN